MSDSRDTSTTTTSHGISDAMLSICMKDFAHKCAIPIVLSDHHSVIQWVNNEAGRRFRYDPALLVGRRIETLMPKVIAEKHSKLVKRFLDTAVPRIEGGPPRLVPVIDGNGNTHLLGLSITAIRPVGHPPYFIAAFIDCISTELVSLRLCQLVITTVKEYPRLTSALLPIIDAFRDCMSLPEHPGAPRTRKFEEAYMISLVDMTKQALLSHPELKFSEPISKACFFPLIVIRTDDAWRMLKSMLAILQLFKRTVENEKEEQEEDGEGEESKAIDEGDEGDDFPVVLTVRQEEYESFSPLGVYPHQLIIASVPMSETVALLLSISSDISKEFLVHEDPPRTPTLQNLTPLEPLGLSEDMSIQPVDDSYLPVSFLRLLARFHHAHADTGICRLSRPGSEPSHCLVWLRLYTATRHTTNAGVIDIPPVVRGVGAI